MDAIGKMGKAKHGYITKTEIGFTFTRYLVHAYHPAVSVRIV